MRSISLYHGDNFSSEFYVNYSKFKHGSKTQARQFGRDVAHVCAFEENSNLIFYPAPYNNVCTASSAFKDYLLSFLAQQFKTKNINVKQGKIYREYSYDNDYSLLSMEERRKAITSDIFHIDKSMIKDTDILVFIDDIKITGAHEELIIKLLKREGIQNNTIFIYIGYYTGDNPQIEYELNHKAVNNLIDINNIIRNEEFIFNTRVIKYILKADLIEFSTFISYQSMIFKETLFSFSILNNYHNNIKYKANFNILSDLL